ADLELRYLLHRLQQLTAADAIAEVAGALGDQSAADLALQHLVLQPGAQRRGDLGAAETLLPLCLLAQPGPAGVVDGDLGPAALGGIVGAAEIEVHDAVGAPGGEYHRQQAQDRIREPLAPLVARIALEAVSDTLKHCLGWLAEVRWRSGRDSNPRPPA